MIIRYEQVTSLYKNSRELIYRHSGEYVPNKGDIVNLFGEPYIVYKIGSAVDDEHLEYVYVEVIRINPKTVKEEVK